MEIVLSTNQIIKVSFLYDMIGYMLTCWSAVVFFRTVQQWRDCIIDLITMMYAKYWSKPEVSCGEELCSGVLFSKPKKSEYTLLELSIIRNELID